MTTMIYLTRASGSTDAVEVFPEPKSAYVTTAKGFEVVWLTAVEAAMATNLAKNPDGSVRYHLDRKDLPRVNYEVNWVGVYPFPNLQAVRDEISKFSHDPIVSEIRVD